MLLLPYTLTIHALSHMEMAGPFYPSLLVILIVSWVFPHQPVVLGFNACVDHVADDESWEEEKGTG